MSSPSVSPIRANGNMIESVFLFVFMKNFVITHCVYNICTMYLIDNQNVNYYLIDNQIVKL